LAEVKGKETRDIAAHKVPCYEKAAKERQGTRTDSQDNIVEFLPPCEQGKAHDLAAKDYNEAYQCGALLRRTG